MKNYTATPAHLWIGSQEILLVEVMNFLQQLLCKQNGCGTCTTCTAIRAQQHHAVVWIMPDKQYTLEDLEIIHERLSFALSPDEQCIFILQRADFLSKQCANSLLKSIEEPPKGYSFILCAERSEHILPTIQSRCIIRSFSHEYVTQHYRELFAFFTTQQPAQPHAFLQYLQKCTINEADSIDLIDKLLTFWMQKYTQAMYNNLPHTHAQQCIIVLKEGLSNPPMPGASKLFWKHMYSEFYE